MRAVCRGGRDGRGGSHVVEVRAEAVGGRGRWGGGCWGRSRTPACGWLDGVVAVGHGRVDRRVGEEGSIRWSEVGATAAETVVRRAGG